MTELTPEDVCDALEEVPGTGTVEQVDEVEIPGRAPDRVLAFHLRDDGVGVAVEETTRHDAREDVPGEADLRAPIWHREDGALVYRFEAVGDGE